jgi:uridine monophosphate synthetase
MKSLILDLYAIQAIQFGSFTLKNGLKSPIYIDLRLLISYPLLMGAVTAALSKLSTPLSFDLLCGVPYAAIPIATALSLQQQHPMVMCRKEVKSYGTKKQIEGKFEAGQTCLLIEDVVTFGTSILETATLLREQNLIINDAVAIVDRCQGGTAALKEQSITLHALLRSFDILDVLLSQHKISSDTFKKVRDFLSSS